MSRHKLVKALDLDDELNDFDGGAESEYEEVGADDKEQLRLGIIKVRNVIGDDIRVTDKEIEDSLWHYYYDTEKTINYLLSQKTKLQPKKTKVSQSPKNDVEGAKPNGERTAAWSQGLWLRVRNGAVAGSPIYIDKCMVSEYPFGLQARCSATFSMAEFFKDAPWLNIPSDRLGEILIEPIHRQRGLLGGGSRQDGAPKSKLAALAAARKKKENRKTETDQPATSSVALLDKLVVKPQEVKLYTASNTSSQESQHIMAEKARDVPARKYPNRQQTDTAPAIAEQPMRGSSSTMEPPPESTLQEKPGITPLAAPSPFARIAFGPSAKPAHAFNDHALQGFESHTEFDFAGLSPDDVVISAQNSRGPTQKATKPTSQPASNKGAVADVVQGVKDVAIEESRVKGKNLDVLAEFERSKPKNAANFVVIGHVDAGKSTLMGRMLHDLNVVDKRTIDKYRKEAERLGKSSFALAWVLDQGTEERERGVTIDIAMNKFETQTTSFTILDAPGHRDFIPNMIAGASQADFAVLVIDASTGNFESGLKGQTKEHALLVRSMGVQRIVVAINKLDTVQWSEHRFEEIHQQVSAFLTSAGFLPKNLAFVPCAGLSGENITRKAEDPKASWYKGPTLISVLESSEPIARALDKPLRLTIDDVFRGGVQNPLSISGRLDAGSVQVGDSIQVMPVSHEASIKGLEVDSEPADWAVAGQNIILHLTDIEAKYLKSGDVVCSPSAPIQCITSWKVKILAFEHITPMHCEIHKGRLHAPGRVTKLVAQLDKASGTVEKGKKPRLIKPGSVARIVVEVDDPIPLEQGGRIIIRAGGETVGAGLVE